MTRSTRGEELLLLLLMLLYLLLCSDSRHAKRAENVNAIDRKIVRICGGKTWEKRHDICVSENNSVVAREKMDEDVIEIIEKEKSKETLLRRSRKGGGVLGRETRT